MRHPCRPVTHMAFGHARAIIIGPTVAGGGYTVGSLRNWVRRETRGMHDAFTRPEGHRDIGSE